MDKYGLLHIGKTGGTAACDLNDAYILRPDPTGEGSAQIDMVSGASFTSNGYVTSLQSAIDQANL